jgi:hypothetical protein
MNVHKSSGFALILVLWTLVLLSTIALTFAATVRTEVQSAQDLWDDLQAELLAGSGHDLAAYLAYRFTEAKLRRALELVAGHAEGNPFFVEEVLADLLDRGLLERNGDGWFNDDANRLRQIVDDESMGRLHRQEGVRWWNGDNSVQYRNCSHIGL